MNIRGIAKAMWLLSNARELLIKSWVSAQDLQWIDFTNPASFWSLAAKIGPEILKRNPQIAKQIKESWWLDWKTKEEVINVVDNI